jgi:hypothetical protein
MTEDNKFIAYDKSPIPSAKPRGIASERHPDRGIDVDDRGRLNYQSASASGHVEIELPSLPGNPNATEKLHVRDFGSHVAAKIESAMDRMPYLRSGEQVTAPGVLFHYAAAARGAQLMDEGSLKRLTKLAEEFQEESEKREFFSQVVRPYLLSLSPERRRP